jgi:hypothetical protein
MERQSYLERDRDSIRTDFAPQAENVMLVRGSCLCRAVGYEARLPFAKFVNCHCSRCRKASGSAFAANAYVLPDAFRWTRGENVVVRYDLPEARSFASSFCGKCGSPVPHGTRSGREIIIPAGSLDDDPRANPSTNVHWSSRAGWSPRFSELPTHTCHRDPSPSQSSRRRSHHFMCGAGR